MTKINIISIIFLFTLSGLLNSVLAQAPEGIIYQAEARDDKGDLIKKEALEVNISIIQDSETGLIVWEGLHSVTTDSYGMFVLVIGYGVNSTGLVFEDINWALHKHFLNVQVQDPKTLVWVDMGTSQLLSVPYSLHSKTTSEALTADYNNLYNLPVNVSHFINDVGYITDADNTDPDPTNEIQDLQLVGNILTITLNGTATEIDLTPYLDNTNLSETEVDAMVENNGYQLSVDDGDIDDTNEIQDITGIAINATSIANETTRAMAAEGANAAAISGLGTMALQDQITVDIDGGTIDGTDIGSGAAADGKFVALETTQNLTLPPSTASTGIIYSGSNTFIHTFGTDNIFMGEGAGNLSTTSTQNVGIGKRALRNTTGSSNTAIGVYALAGNTIGSANTAVGNTSMASNDVGDSNTAVGIYSMQFNKDGSANTAVGKFALRENVSGHSNVAIGRKANQLNVTGSNNTMVGTKAGGEAPGANRSGSVFLGYEAGMNETGSNKLFIENSSDANPLIYGEFDNDLARINGDLEVTGTIKIEGGSPGLGKFLTSDATGSASWSEMTYSSISGLGTMALQDNVLVDIDGGTIDGTTIGSGTPANGTFNALESTQNLTLLPSTATSGIVYSGSNTLIHTFGEHNTFMGEGAGNLSTTSQQNVGIGKNALHNTTTGGWNTALGLSALGGNTTGEQNTALGNGSMANNDNGFGNTAVGIYTLMANIGGSSNTAIGSSALNQNTIGENNVAIGFAVNTRNESGSNNTMVGTMAGAEASGANRSGSVFLGYQAGMNETGSNKLFIENSSDANPLIYGEFDNDLARINGDLEVTGTIKIEGGSPGDGKVLTSNGSGLASWESLPPDNVDDADADPTNEIQDISGIAINATALTNETARAIAAEEANAAAIAANKNYVHSFCAIADAVTNSIVSIGNMEFRYNSSAQGGYIEARTIEGYETLQVYCTKKETTWELSGSSSSSHYKCAWSFDGNWQTLINLADPTTGTWLNTGVPLGSYDTQEFQITQVDFSGSGPISSYKLYTTIDGWLHVVIRAEYFE